MDRAKNTPLHIIVTYKKIVSDFLTLHAIVMALLEAGVHIDSVNAAGQTPLGSATTGVAEIILKSQADMSLKCLAAQSIRKYNINYIGQVQRTVKSFLDLSIYFSGSKSFGVIHIYSWNIILKFGFKYISRGSLACL